MKLQVLVATMHREDTRIADAMNIRCDAVIANQADRDEIIAVPSEYGERKMVTTKSRGVGLNRNIALLAADADIVLFADDDVVYYDSMPSEVIKAFEENPAADVMIFGLDYVKDGEIFDRRRCSDKRVWVWNSMKYGACRIAVRRRTLLENNITFNQCFGGGCPFSAGEDSLFLKSCFDAGLKVFSSSAVLGTCAKDSSSWFVGYNEKYFYDKGVLVRKLFPKCAYIMALYFGIFFKRETDLSVNKRVRLVYKGVRGGKKMLPYGDYNEKNPHC